MNTNPSTAKLVLNRAALWGALRLHGSQVARMTGATLRMVQHWTARGYLSTTADGDYTAEALELCALIMQGKAEGLSVARAVAAARISRGDFVGLGDVEPQSLTQLAALLREQALELTETWRIVDRYATARQSHAAPAFTQAAD